MPARFRLRTFEQVRRDIEDSRRWYKQLGIETHGTRLHDIQVATDELLADLEELPPEDVVARWSNQRTYYALSDGASFGRIAREIPKVGPNLLPRRKLRTILEGPLSPMEENPSDASVNARNVFTELELAADLSTKGIKPKGFDDLQFDFEGVAYSVQCKRLHSQRRVEDNVAAAYRQLKANLATDHDRGLIGLSVEKILDLDGKILRLERQSALNAIVYDLINQFRTAHQRTWLNFVDTRVIGILVILRFLCFTVQRNVIGPAYYLGFVNLATPEALQATELERLRRLVDHLRAAAAQVTEPLSGT